MLYDPYPTVRHEITVRYASGREQRLFRGSLKPSAALFDWGGCYGFRFALQNEEIDFIDFTVTGEGAFYPTHFRYTLNGKKFVCSRAEGIAGRVLRAENLSFNDTRFAEMGNEDGVAHFRDIALSKERHTVRVYFRPFTGARE